MCGLLLCMESNKSVEDIHQPIRMDAKANQNSVLSKDHIQELIIHSNSLEARKVHHGARVTKDSGPLSFKFLLSKGFGLSLPGSAADNWGVDPPPAVRLALP